MIPRAKFDEIDEADIQRLIDDGVRESRTLDFNGAARSVRGGQAPRTCAHSRTLWVVTWCLG